MLWIIILVCQIAVIIASRVLWTCGGLNIIGMLVAFGLPFGLLPIAHQLLLFGFGFVAKQFGAPT